MGRNAKDSEWYSTPEAKREAINAGWRVSRELKDAVTKAAPKKAAGAFVERILRAALGMEPLTKTALPDEVD